MKRKIVAFVSAIMIAAAACPVSAFALEDGFEKKSVKAYLFSMDKSEELECLFSQALPEVPYISAEDYLDRIYTVDFTTASSGDVYTVSGNEMTITVDAAKDTVVIKNYDIRLQKETVEAEDKSEHSNYIDQLPDRTEGENKDAEFTLSDYNIDLIGEDGKVYFPLSTISDIFDPSYNAAEYVNGNIYFVASMSSESGKDGYFDRSSVYEKEERSQAMADFTYNEFCFVIDNLYACPSKAPISESILKNGMDKSLDSFSDDTRKAKELLHSTSRLDNMVGMTLLFEAFNDGGHTVFAGFLTEMDTDDLIGTSLVDSYISKMNDDNDPFSKRVQEIMASTDKDSFSDNFRELRDTNYAKLEKVKEWPGDDKTAFYVNGATAYFVFDSFDDEVIESFKWSLDYAKEKGIRNFVIDISANGGGDSDVVCYINAMINNKNKDNNNYSISMNSFASGNNIVRNYALDMDLNGTIDEKDKEVYYDFNYAIMTSEISFSCGNLMPILAKKDGVPILGWTSDGGSCMVVKHYFPDSMFYFASSIYKLITLDDLSADFEEGVEPNCLLAQITEDHRADYENFFDFVKIESFIDGFYGVEPEPSGDDTPSGTDKPASTGASNTAALVAAACAAVVILTVRRKSKAQ